VDDVRRRVQQQIRGHGGCRDQPLYRIRATRNKPRTTPGRSSSITVEGQAVGGWDGDCAPHFCDSAPDRSGAGCACARALVRFADDAMVIWRSRRQAEPRWRARRRCWPSLVWDRERPRLKSCTSMKEGRDWIPSAITVGGSAEGTRWAHAGEGLCKPSKRRRSTARSILGAAPT
jgi:hypothetical protein